MNKTIVQIGADKEKRAHEQHQNNLVILKLAN